MLPTTPSTFGEFMFLLTDLIDAVIPIVFSLTLLVFFWGVVKSWILHGGNEKEVESGKKLTVVGLIVLAVMFSIWGILRILRFSLFGQL